MGSGLMSLNIHSNKSRDSIRETLGNWIDSDIDLKDGVSSISIEQVDATFARGLAVECDITVESAERYLATGNVYQITFWYYNDADTYELREFCVGLREEFTVIAEFLN